MLSTNDAFRAAGRAGAIVGLALGGLVTIQLMLALAGLNADAQQDLGNAVLIADFAAFFIVGLVLRRRTSSIEAGMRAGLLSGAYAGALALVGAAVLAVLAPSVNVAAVMVMAPSATGFGATLFAALLNLVMLAAIGAGLALTGALAARPRSAAAAPRSPLRVQEHLGR